VELNRSSHELRVTYKGRELLTYVFAAHPFKPYVRELRTLTGVNVLLDAPPDHLHHHGLMYAIKVNGTNFWEETPQAGYEIPGPEITRTVRKNAASQPVAELSQVIYWVGSSNAPDPPAAALLVEARTLALTVDEPAREVALDWRSDFEVGKGSDPVTLSGAVYHGLGCRFPEAFNRVAHRQNSAGAPYTEEAKQDVSAGSWASVSHNLDGQDITVTLFADPANASESRFFSMLNPFAYLSATQGLDTKPLEYRAGQKFSLRYLATVHSGTRTREALDERRRRWLTP
jgi:hypothetical protein